MTPVSKVCAAKSRPCAVLAAQLLRGVCNSVHYVPILHATLPFLSYVVLGPPCQIGHHLPYLPYCPTALLPTVNDKTNAARDTVVQLVTEQANARIAYVRQWARNLIEHYDSQRTCAGTVGMAFGTCGCCFLNTILFSQTADYLNFREVPSLYLS